jgi:hypothetical protein
MDKRHFDQLIKGVREMKRHIAETSNAQSAAERKKMKAAGWETGNAKDFLQLTDKEAVLVERKATQPASPKPKQPRLRK